MSNNSIKQVRAYEVLDSRGNPTVAAEVILNNNQNIQHESVRIKQNRLSKFGG